MSEKLKTKQDIILWIETETNTLRDAIDTVSEQIDVLTENENDPEYNGDPSELYDEKNQSESRLDALLQLYYQIERDDPKTISMTPEIVSVINAVLAYQRWLYCDAVVNTGQGAYIADKLKDYYQSLNLPPEMDQNQQDLDYILTFRYKTELLNKLTGRSANDPLLKNTTWKPHPSKK